MPPIAALIPLIGNVIDRILPDKTEAQRAKAQLDLLKEQGELQLIMGQLDINKVEAGHGSTFVAGWRPFVGWVCGTALAYEYIALPILSWICLNADWELPPHIVMDGMLELVLAMLGVAGLRTVEKIQGVAR